MSGRQHDIIVSKCFVGTVSKKKIDEHLYSNCCWMCFFSRVAYISMIVNVGSFAQNHVEVMRFLLKNNLRFRILVVEAIC